MKRLALFLFLHFSQAHKHFEECLIDYRSMQNAWEERLQEKIMCNFNFRLPPKPLNNSDSIVVSISFTVKSFKYLSANQEFSISTYTYISYEDERLTWEPSDYGGLDRTVMNSYKLWLPVIKLINSVSDAYDQRYDTSTPCSISRKGHIQCISWITFQVKCASDLNDWPFDTQVCSLEFGTTVSQGTKVRLDFDTTAVMFIGSEYGAEWDIMDYTQEENQDAVRQLKMYFTMVRHAETLAATVIYPSILLSVIIISSLYLDVRCVSRLYVTCFSLMCHFYFLSELKMVIPEHSKNSPRILLYFRGSVIMNIISLVMTYLLKFICEREEPVPNFIAIVNEYAYKTYSRFAIYPRWETATDVGKNKVVKAWTDFANILNSVWIYVCLTVCIIMCCVFIPSPTGLTQNIRSQHYVFE